jgi:zinc/manganese transport system permease protein
VTDWLLNLHIIGPALLAGILVLASHVPLGREVLQRGIIFLDIAIAQIAALGVVLASVLDLGAHPWASQAIAIGSALLGAWLLQQTERRFPNIQEAIIGSSFVLAATGALLLLAGHPQGAEHLKDLLSGQILWVGHSQLAALALVTLLVLAAWLSLTASSRSRWFYPLFAISITASVQLVGVYLVFSSLIIPALAVRHFRRHAVIMAFVIGIIGYTLGLLGSALYDYPAGPLVVWSLAAVGLVAAWWHKHIMN